MKLTIGFPTYDDYSGMEMSLQPLAMFHDLADVELVVVNNHPTGDEAERKLQRYARDMRAKYVPLARPVGTAAPRDKIFEVAGGDVVLVADGHVILGRETLRTVREYFAQPDHARDILTGPILRNRRRAAGPGLDVLATHYADEWRGGMWGTWAQAWRCAQCRGDWHFDVFPRPSAPARLRLDEQGLILPSETPRDPSPPVDFYRVGMGREPAFACPACGKTLPTNCTEAEHVRRLESLGFERRCWSPDDNEPFEIPGLGLGMFAMRNEHWPRFPEGMQGFGGGELHLHELVRRNGGRAVCHPLATWWHRFDRERVPYPLTLWSKLRNYVLWRRRLDMPLDPVHAHFVAAPGAQINEAQWQWLLDDPLGRTDWPGHLATPQPSASAALAPTSDTFARLANSKDRATPHMETIRRLAEHAPGVVIFGKRPHWEAAAADAQPESLLARDAAESLSVEPTTCDLLVLDTIHSAERLRAELARWAPLSRRWIVVYGTEAFGDTAEGGKGSGMLAAIDELTDGGEWQRVFHDVATSGLSVLSRDPRERSIDSGPGSQLARLLRSLGVASGSGCDCKAKAATMDQWGVEQCRARRDEIIGWLRDGAPRWGWSAYLKAAGKAVLTGLAFRLDPTDPFPGLVDEAIRRAESKCRVNDEGPTAVG